MGGYEQYVVVKAGSYLPYSHRTMLSFRRRASMPQTGYDPGQNESVL